MGGGVVSDFAVCGAAQMSRLSTVKLLWEWARWGQGQSIDYPSMSPMFGERTLKTPLYGTGDMPADVAMTEKAVCAVQLTARLLIIQKYQRHQKPAQIARDFHVSWWKAKRAIEQAEGEVDHVITQLLANDSNSGVYTPLGSKTVTTQTPHGVFAFRRYENAR